MATLGLIDPFGLAEITQHPPHSLFEASPPRLERLGAGSVADTSAFCDSVEDLSPLVVSAVTQYQEGGNHQHRPDRHERCICGHVRHDPSQPEVATLLSGGVFLAPAGISPWQRHGGNCLRHAGKVKADRLHALQNSRPARDRGEREEMPPTAWASRSRLARTGRDRTEDNPSRPRRRWQRLDADDRFIAGQNLLQ